MNIPVIAFCDTDSDLQVAGGGGQHCFFWGRVACVAARPACSPCRAAAPARASWLGAPAARATAAAPQSGGGLDSSKRPQQGKRQHGQQQQQQQQEQQQSSSRPELQL